MTPERWLRVTSLIRRARECDPSERADVLAEACGDDDVLRHEVESLLAACDGPGDPFEEPLLAADEADALWAEALAYPETAGDAPAVTSIYQEQTERAAAEATARAGELVGETLEGKYRIDALLGRGGMGEVYLATHIHLARRVAVKVIRSDVLDTGAALERFLREAQIVARLRHPNIVTVHDYGFAEGVGAYLVLEYLDGHSLRAELGMRKRFDARTALEVIGQVCAAVSEAHGAGIVHRDLKPDNVILERGTRGLSVKVLDFGLAKLAEEAGSLDGAITKRGAVLGTPAYMAPEQCRGEVTDARSDVYALGCVLYEMLTGRAPFTARSVTALLYQHVHEPVRPPGELVDGLDPALDEAILAALAKRPEDRPATAGAFARALGLRVESVGLGTLSPIGAHTGETARETGSLDRPSTGMGAGPTNLRHAVTRFVGRELEIAEIRDRLSTTRLVTITGPGGIGKTRLALEVASQLVGEYRDGVWLAELAGLTDASLVDKAVASALGVREQGERPVGEVLAAWLATKDLLLVLDNCEHLIDACARLAASLLEAVPGLTVLATSREALAVPGEAVWPVRALAVPESDSEAFACETARLFADRAALARPDFELSRSSEAVVAELCRRLEGIPLAIELAAARVKALTVEEIVERLGDRFRLLAGGSRTGPSRHQTLLATIAWSYGLLTDDERALLRRLAVFAGGWTLEAAEQVVGDERAEADVLDLLMRLVDKSLVTVRERRRSTRYRMLETIREFALERLAESDELDGLRRRHAAYFLAEAGAGRKEIGGGKYAEWLELLEDDHDNLRAALGWLLVNDPDGCLRLVNPLSDFWLYHGHLREGARWLAAALDRSDSPPLRSVALRAAGEFAYRMGDLAAARARLEESLRACRETGDELQLGWTTHHLAAVVFQQGDTSAARGYFEESLAIATELGDAHLAGNSLNMLGEVARFLGEWDVARPLYERSLASHREAGLEVGLSVTLCNLGATVLEEGDLDGARRHFLDALEMSRAFGNTLNASLALDGLGAVAAGRGEWERAARLAGAAAAIREPIGFELEPADRAFRERYVAAVRESLGEATFDEALAEGRSLALEDAARLVAEGADTSPA